jgi:hypothetical protein
MLVLGTLGDLVKKICELETAARMSTRETAVQMTTYHKLLEEWPVESKTRIKYLTVRFKLLTIQLKTVGHEMEKQLAGITATKFKDEDAGHLFVALLVAKRYCFLKQQLRNIYNELNLLSQIGSPPYTMGDDNESGRDDPQDGPAFLSDVEA